MAKNQNKFVALILVNTALVLAFATGAALMYEAVVRNNFNLNLYMVSTGIMMTTSFIAVHTFPSLRNLIWNTRKVVKNFAEQTGKFLAHGNDHKKADQQA